ncbi:MAG: twin-arginine translocase TatA/TatE family subunit [Ignavibacteriaceae bacterium]|nr:twin-arginine translocase TatA/TatE family subunit [Ignavibacteriaceae bacterium]
MFSNIGTGEIIVIGLVILLVFGPKRLPEILRSFGKGLREVKKSMSDVETEIKKSMDTEDKPKDNTKNQG